MKPLRKLNRILAAAALTAALGAGVCAAEESAGSSLPAFEYTENDPMQAAVTSLILRQAEDLFGDSGSALIPCAVLEYFDEEDPARPVIWGSFGVSLYDLEDGVLVEKKEYSSRGNVILNAQEDGSYSVESWNNAPGGDEVEALEGWNEDIASAMDHLEADTKYAKTEFLRMYCLSAGLTDVSEALLADGTEIGLVFGEEVVPAEEENSAEQYPAFEYTGTDGIEAAVSSALLLLPDEKLDDLRQNLVSIPCPVIRVFNPDDPSRIELWGDFGISNYAVDQGALVETAGIRRKGRILLEPDGNGGFRVSDLTLAASDEELAEIEGFTEEIAAALEDDGEDETNVRTRFLTMYCRSAAPLGITSCVLLDGTEIDLSGAYETDLS